MMARLFSTLFAFFVMVEGFQQRLHRAKTLSLNTRLRLNAEVIKHSEFLRDGMSLRPLGTTDMLVSKACMGTIMWGQQVSERTASDMMTVANEEFGVNFIDTSEVYPMPNDEEYFGKAEEIVGRWLKTVDRSSIIVGTKMAGYHEYLPYARKGPEKGTRVTKAQIRESVEGSLKRLDTDYIDLFQIGWPDRYTPVHGDKFFDVERADQEFVSFQEQVDGIRDLVKEGKIRHFGLSNESPYGLLKFKEAFGKESDITVCSMQNAYNLLERNDVETSLLEACHYSNTSLIAHTPLAAGALTSKYNQPLLHDPEDVVDPDVFGDPDLFRLNLFPGFTLRYKRPEALRAINAYRALGMEYGVSTTQLSLAWCYSRPFITSTILGATTVKQMRENLMAMNCPMTLKMEANIFELYVNKYRDPTSGVSILYGDEDDLTLDEVPESLKVGW